MVLAVIRGEKWEASRSFHGSKCTSIIIWTKCSTLGRATQFTCIDCSSLSPLLSLALTLFFFSRYGEFHRWRSRSGQRVKREDSPSPARLMKIKHRRNKVKYWSGTHLLDLRPSDKPWYVPVEVILATRSVCCTHGMRFSSREPSQRFYDTTGLPAERDSSQLYGNQILSGRLIGRLRRSRRCCYNASQHRDWIASAPTTPAVLPINFSPACNFASQRIICCIFSCIYYY